MTNRDEAVTVNNRGGLDSQQETSLPVGLSAMKRLTSDIAFTPAVKAAQEQRGSREAYARMDRRGGWQNKVTADLAEFIAERDSFYLATASADGQPYIQHRGGPKGFLKVLDEHTLAFADFVGNAQYISIGNLDENNKAFIFLMDYPNRRRIKIWGTAQFIEGEHELLSRLTDSAYGGKPERALVFQVQAWDVNCPQHIKPRWTEEEISPVVDELRARVEQLEAENARLRAQQGGDLDHEKRERHEKRRAEGGGSRVEGRNGENSVRLAIAKRTSRALV